MRLCFFPVFLSLVERDSTSGSKELANQSADTFLVTNAFKVLDLFFLFCKVFSLVPLFSHLKAFNAV